MLSVLQTGLSLLIKSSSLIGLIIDLVGTLYLAYDLFGQRHGPLRTLTETITYVILGIVFGTAALGVIAFDAVNYDPYFSQTVSILGAISVLLSFGAMGGLGAGCGYALTIEKKWNAGKPKLARINTRIRVLLGLLLGIVEGLLVYVIMANFRNTHDISSGLVWGGLQGLPMGLLFGWLVGMLLVRFSQQWETDQLLEARRTGTLNDALPQRPFDIWGLYSGIATGIGVGPITALSYFALYGPFVLPTFILITIAGIVGGTGLGLILATVERTLLWVDLLPAKRLGIVGAFFIFVGFMFQATQQVLLLAQPPVR